MRFLTRDGLTALLWSAVLCGLLSLVLVYQFLPSRIHLQVGDVSPQNIRAPQKITYVSEIRTAREREAAIVSVGPIYTLPDRLLAQQQVNRARAITDYINAVRQDSYADVDTKREYLSAIEEIDFSPQTIELIIQMREAAWRTVTDQTASVIEQIMRTEIRDEQVWVVRSQVPTYINVNLTSNQTQAINEWVLGLVVPNSFLDKEKTEAAQDAARQGVDPVRIAFEKGQIVVREGEIVSDMDVEALQALGLQRTDIGWVSILSVVFFVLLLVVVLTMYMAQRHAGILGDARLATLLLVLIASFTLVSKTGPSPATRFSRISYRWPLSRCSLARWWAPTWPLVVTAFLALMVGYISGGSLELIVYSFVSGALAALMVWRVERLNTFVWTGVMVSITNLAVVLTFGLINQNADITSLLALGTASLVSGGIAASVTLVGFYVFGNLLQVTTFLQLMELARPTYPLLQKLLVEAPGTYHHTILVSNLTERAAQDIGADPLLARVGAYYHDVGKTLQPYYFTENQVDGVNVHERLDPKTSAQIIVGHVREGIALAKK